MVRQKSVLLRSTALCIGLTASLAIVPRPAGAACTSYAPTSGTTVTCSGTSSSPVTAAPGATNLTVTVEDGAQLTAGAGVNLRSSSTINITGSVTAASGAAAGITGDNSAINISGSAVVTSPYVAVNIFGNGNSLSVSDLSQIEGGLYAIQVDGDNNSVNFSGSSLVQAVDSTILVYGDGNAVALNDKRPLCPPSHRRV
jgi:hypothetical protein